MSEEEDFELCGAEYSSEDKVCERVGDYPDGKCGYHTDYKEKQSGDGNVITGIHQNRSGYYEDADPEDQEWMDAIVDSFLEDADFDESHEGKITLLRNVAIDLHKKRRADEHIQMTGMTQTDVEGFHEQYGPLKKTNENVLHLTADRLSRSSLRILKELDVIDSPDSKQAEAQSSMLEKLSQIDDED